MIEQADKLVVEWVRTIVPSTTVTLAPPESGAGAARISCYLVELASLAAGANTTPAHRPPQQLRLRYLVSACAPTPEEAHRLLGQLVFAAMDRADFTVDTDGAPPALWRDFAIAPRPGFVLEVPLRREREPPRGRMVRHPLVLEHTRLRPLSGRVLGPGKTPLAGARVLIPAARLSAETDAHGRFGFAAVPGTDAATVLLVRARDRELAVSVAAGHDPHQPLTITFPITET